MQCQIKEESITSYQFTHLGLYAQVICANIICTLLLVNGDQFRKRTPRQQLESRHGNTHPYPASYEKK